MSPPCGACTRGAPSREPGVLGLVPTLLSPCVAWCKPQPLGGLGASRQQVDGEARAEVKGVEPSLCPTPTSLPRRGACRRLGVWAAPSTRSWGQSGWASCPDSGACALSALGGLSLKQGFCEQKRLIRKFWGQGGLHHRTQTVQSCPSLQTIPVRRLVFPQPRAQEDPPALHGPSIPAPAARSQHPSTYTAVSQHPSTYATRSQHPSTCRMNPVSQHLCCR